MTNDEAKRQASWLAAYLAAARPLLASQTRPFTPDRWERLNVDRLVGTLSAIAKALPGARRQGTGIDVWSIVGLRRDEVQIARVLSWLLDPRGSHGAGDAYLQGVWRAADAESTLGFKLVDPLRVTRENYPLADAGSRVDIEVVGRKFLVFIEVKVGASEGRDQLKRYEDLALKKAQNMKAAGRLDRVDCAVLYLTVGEPTPSRANLLHLTWRTAARSIRQTARQFEASAFSTRLAVSFADHVGRL